MFTNVDLSTVLLANVNIKPRKSISFSICWIKKHVRKISRMGQTFYVTYISSLS
jgi:hypothetical protein